MNNEKKPSDADLVLTRVIDVPPHLVWKAWTIPQHLEKWFCPRPYQAIVLEMDVQPGGAFCTLIKAPDGASLSENKGCFLEVVENERLSFTSGLTAGFRPADKNSLAEKGCSSFFFTAIITLEAAENGSTLYTARALHSNGDDRQRHAEMGFQEGWGIALDQLVEYVKKHLM
jgi:uncharacterized protein YndB with AHSA1/START domain